MATKTAASTRAPGDESLSGDRRLFLIDGPSLVYRAFYALPESIATSTGVPTNAIFGFASMLVKIVTEYGVRPTVVAWDAGTSGRTELFAEYKSTRRSRPDLLKQQWPAMEPLVEAFGYRNVKIDGYEADDVIASITERALTAETPVPVMIVTGDRDIFQLIDEAGHVKVMATSRGITETKIYDHQAVVNRYGIPPELIPDFYGLKGDTSDNIPGVPGIGDKTASELIQRFGSLDEVLGRVGEISGPKRKQNLLDHAEDARVSKRLATIQRDVALEHDITAEAAHEPDRSRVREVFRQYELRDPLRRLEEALGDPEVAAPALPAEVKLGGRVRAGSPTDLARLGSSEDELALVVRETETPEGELFAEGPPWRFAVAVTTGNGAEVLAGDCDGPEQVVQGAQERAVVAHDAKALGRVPPGLAHDTLLGAFLLEPARRRFPFDELCEERGLASDLEDPLAADALLLRALAAWQREQIAERGLDRVMDEIELPLVAVLRDMELLGVRLNLERLAEISARVRAELIALEEDIFLLAEAEFLISLPQQLGEIPFEKLGLSRKRRGKTGFSTDSRCCRRSATSTRSSRRSSAGASSRRSPRPTSTCCPARLTSARGSTRRSCRPAPRQGAWRARTRTCRTSQSAPRSGARFAAASRPRESNVLISADYSQIELRVLAHAAEEPVLKEIFVREEDVHTATASRSSKSRQTRSTLGCARRRR